MSGPARRDWTWAGVLERLKSLRRQAVKLSSPNAPGMHGTTVTLTSRPDEEQKRLLDLLEVALAPRP